MQRSEQLQNVLDICFQFATAYHYSVSFFSSWSRSTLVWSSHSAFAEGNEYSISDESTHEAFVSPPFLWPRLKLYSSDVTVAFEQKISPKPEQWLCHLFLVDSATVSILSGLTDDARRAQRPLYCSRGFDQAWHKHLFDKKLRRHESTRHKYTKACFQSNCLKDAVAQVELFRVELGSVLIAQDRWRNRTSRRP